MADSVLKGITVEIGGDTTNLEKSISSINKESKSLREELYNVDRLLKFDPSNTDLLAQKQALLAKQVEEAARRVDLLSKGQAAMNELVASGKVEKGGEDYRKMERDVIAAEQALTKAKTALDGFGKKQESTTPETDNLRNSIKSQEKELSDLKSRYAETVLSQGKHSDAAKSLEKQISVLNYSLNDNKEKLNYAENATEELTQKTEENAKSAEKSGSIWSSFGGVLKTIGAAAVAAAAAVGAAAVKMVKDLVGATNDAAAYADNMATLSAQTHVTTDELQAYGYAAGLVDVPLNTLTDSMAKQIKSMSDVNNVSAEATVDTGKLAAAQARAANTALDVEKAQTKASNAVLDVEKAQIKYNEAVAKYTASSPQAAQAALDLEKAQNNATVAALDLEKAQNNLTAANSAVEEASKAVSPELNEMTAAYNRLGVSVYDTATGKMRDSETVYWEIIDALSQVEDETERDSLAMTILGKSAQDLNPLIQMGAEQLEALKQEARDAGAVLSEDTLNSLLAVSDGMDRMKGSTGAAKNALGTIGAGALASLYTGMSGVMQDMTGMINAAVSGEGISDDMISGMSVGITEMVNSVAAEIPEIISVINEIITSIVQVIGESAPQIVATLSDFIPQFITIVSGALPTIIALAGQIIGVLVAGLIDAMPMIMDGAITLIMALVNSIIEQLPALANSAVQIILALVNGLADALPVLVPAAVNAIMTIIQGLIDNLPKILDAALNIILALADGILAALPQLIAALPAIIEGIYNFLYGAIPQIIQAGITLLTSLIGALPEIISTIVLALPDIIIGITTAIMDNIPAIIQAGIMLFVALVQATPEIILGIIKAIPLIIKGITDAFDGYVGKIKDAGKNLIAGLWQGIQDTTQWIKDKIAEFCSGIVDSIKAFFGINSPSKLFQDEIGKFLAQGIGLGFSDEMKNVTRDMQDALPTDFSTEVNAALHASSVGGGAQTFEVKIPVVLDKKIVGQTVSRFQFDAVTNRSRVLGVPTK